MLSIPKATVETLDELALEAGLTRSALVASLAAREAAARRQRRSAAVLELLGTPVRHGNVAELVRADRHR